MMKIVCPNICGYNNKARRIMYNSTVGAIWRYALSVFVHRPVLLKNVKVIRRSHRKALIACTRAYNTVGYLPLTLIAAWPPMDYEIVKRSIKYAYKKGYKIQTYSLNIDHIFDNMNRDINEIIKEIDTKINEKWEEEWKNYNTESTMKILFPTVNKALDAPIYSNFFLTQAISGHGCLRAYRHRIGKISNSNCLVCPDSIEDTMHLVTSCIRFNDDRPVSKFEMNTERIKFLEKCIKRLWILENGPVNDNITTESSDNIHTKVKKTCKNRKTCKKRKTTTTKGKCNIA